MSKKPNTNGLAVARRLVADRYPQARAAWLGGSVASGHATETSDLDITVLLSGPPAPFRNSEMVDGWPVEWFVQTEESLLQFCDHDRTRRRRPTTMRLVGSAVVLVDADGSGARLRNQLHAMDRQGPPPIRHAELENHRYAVTDLLEDLTGAQYPDERLTVAAALVWATAELQLAVNRRWSGSGKWLMRELALLDSAHSTHHAPQLIGGLREAAAGDPGPLSRSVLEVLNAAGGPVFDGYHRSPDDAAFIPARVDIRAGAVDEPGVAALLAYAVGESGAANNLTITSLGEKYPGVERFRVSLHGPAVASAPNANPSRPGWANEAIALVDADPEWQSQGQRLRDTLHVLLAPWLTARIEHVGSTAVPDLPAKPIIDLQAAVTDLDEAESMAAVLGPHDWHYVAPHLDQRPWRRLFVKVAGEQRTAHLHIMTTETPRWHQQIAFRDALRADPAIKADYTALKQAVAQRYSDDREAYSAAKESFIQAILGREAD